LDDIKLDQGRVGHVDVAIAVKVAGAVDRKVKFFFFRNCVRNLLSTFTEISFLWKNNLPLM
jgi:hypothetical protein